MTVTEYMSGCPNGWIRFQIDEIKTSSFKGKKQSKETEEIKETLPFFKGMTSVMKRSWLLKWLLFLKWTHLVIRSILLRHSNMGNHRSFWKQSIFNPRFVLVQVWCYLRQMPALSLSPLKGYARTWKMKVNCKGQALRWEECLVIAAPS